MSLVASTYEVAVGMVLNAVSTTLLSPQPILPEDGERFFSQTGPHFHIFTMAYNALHRWYQER